MNSRHSGLSSGVWEWRREIAGPLVIGHRGAPREAPENTIAAFEAAAAIGVDLVELDVGAGLLVGHPGVEQAGPLLLDDALACLAQAGVGVHVDLKHEGIEEAVERALREHGMAARSVVSSTSAPQLRRLAALEPRLVCAISYPVDRHGASRVAWPSPAVSLGVAALRAAMPLRLPPLLHGAHASAVSLHHTLVSPAVIRSARRRGAMVLAWTVNDPERVAVLARQGVDAIVSDDPRMVRQVLATLDGL